MSYILDALKKSDQERKHREVPGLNSFQDQPKPPLATSRIMLYFLIGALLINGLAVGLWIAFRQDPAVTTIADAPAKSVELLTVPSGEQSPTESPAAVAVKSPVRETARQTTSESPAAEEPAQASEPVMVASETATPGTDLLPEEIADETPDGDTAEPTLTSLEKLPAKIRNDLPKLNISAHYFANNPAARMASINGRILRQGQTIDDGLLLEEITRTGVIFKFRDYRFSMDVFIR